MIAKARKGNNVVSMTVLLENVCFLALTMIISNPNQVILLYKPNQEVTKVMQ